MARSQTAENAWAVAHLEEVRGGWRVKAIFDTACSRDEEIAATAERISEEEAQRYIRRGSTKVLAS